MVKVRKAVAADGEAVARILNGVIAEEKYTAASTPVTAETESKFISSMGPRSVMHVAEVDGSVEGFQTLEPFLDFAASMRHVGVAGTQVTSACRGKGVGRALWDATVAFAKENGYEKVIIYVRAGNDTALGYYRHLGFRDIGIAKKQVFINGKYEDEVFLECFL